jgi:hypothetical protein
MGFIEAKAPLTTPSVSLLDASLPSPKELSVEGYGKPLV